MCTYAYVYVHMHGSTNSTNNMENYMSKRNMMSTDGLISVGVTNGKVYVRAMSPYKLIFIEAMNEVLYDMRGVSHPCTVPTHNIDWDSDDTFPVYIQLDSAHSYDVVLQRRGSSIHVQSII